MRNFVAQRLSALLITVAMTGCGPAHLVQELGYKSDIEKMGVQLKASQQQCRDEMQVSDLDPIRQKVDLARGLSDRDPPAFALASNESFASDAERPVIAKWASMRDVCIKRANSIRVTPTSASASEKMTFPQQMAIPREYSARVSELVLLLYRQKLTYGEFAQKQYEFGRDAQASEFALTQAIVARDDDRQALAQQQFDSIEKNWTDYIQAVSARAPNLQPGSVRSP